MPSRETSPMASRSRKFKECERHPAGLAATAGTSPSSERGEPPTPLGLAISAPSPLGGVAEEGSRLPSARDRRGELYLIGIGLSPRYLTIEALEKIASADAVFVETYTGRVDLTYLGRIVGKGYRRVSRADLEERSGREILELLEEGKRVALLVPGDPLIATTHASLLTEVHARGFGFYVVPGVSIVPSALTMSGLMVYKMGRVATVVYPKNGIVFEYPYDVIKVNDSLNLHSLLLLEYDGDRGVAMRSAEALEILREIEERRREGVVREDRLVAVVASLGYPDFAVCAGELKRISMLDIEAVPQTLVFVSPRPHPVEIEMMNAVSSRWCRVG